MKRLSNAYLSFTRTERIGISALIILLLILIAVKVTMHLWVKPDTADQQQKQQELSAKWEAFKQQQITKTQAPAVINLNTADSATLVSLDGIGAKLAHRILERRRTKGDFTTYEQLYDVYHFPQATFESLKKAGDNQSFHPWQITLANKPIMQVFPNDCHCTTLTHMQLVMMY